MVNKIPKVLYQFELYACSIAQVSGHTTGTGRWTGHSIRWQHRENIDGKTDNKATPWAYCGHCGTLYAHVHTIILHFKSLIISQCLCRINKPSIIRIGMAGQRVFCHTVKFSNWIYGNWPSIEQCKMTGWWLAPLSASSLDMKLTYRFWFALTSKILESGSVVGKLYWKFLACFVTNDVKNWNFLETKVWIITWAYWYVVIGQESANGKPSFSEGRMK